MANATLREIENGVGILVTAGYREPFTRGCKGPGQHSVRTMQPARGPGFEFGRGAVVVSQEDWDKAQQAGHIILPVE